MKRKRKNELLEERGPIKGGVALLHVSVVATLGRDVKGAGIEEN